MLHFQAMTMVETATMRPSVDSDRASVVDADADDDGAEESESDEEMSQLRCLAVVAGQVGDDERGSRGLSAPKGARARDGSETTPTAGEALLSAVGVAAADATMRHLPPAEHRAGIVLRERRPPGASPHRPWIAARWPEASSILPGRATGGVVAGGCQVRRIRRQTKRRAPMHSDGRADESTVAADGVPSEGLSPAKRRRRSQRQQRPGK